MVSTYRSEDGGSFMKKTVLVLLDDYWHRRETIEPALPLLYP